MLEYLNPMPVFSYLRIPTPEHAEAAITFLKNHEDLLATIGNIAKKTFYTLSVLTAIALLLRPRDIIYRDKESQFGATLSISIIEVFAKLFFTMTLLSGFSYLSCKGGSCLASYGINWINFYN